MPGAVDRILRDARAREVLTRRATIDQAVIDRTPRDRWLPAIDLVQGEVSARGAGHFVARIARTGRLLQAEGHDGRFRYRRPTTDR